MDKILEQVFHVGQSEGQVGLDDLLFRLVLALVLGGVIAALYRFTQRPESPASASFLTTLVLICVLLAMVTQVVGGSLSRAFSLVGILSIVRFRTTVEDTRDTAFVILAVIIGMAAGVDNRAVAYVGLAIVGAAAIAMRFLPLNGTATPSGDWVLLLRISTGAGAATPWEEILVRNCTQKQLTSTATAKQGTVLELTYRLQLRPDVVPLQLLNEINRLEGVQNLEMKRAN